MSMLAEPRRKRKKWSKDPRNLNWKNDSSRFSVKLMEKMGWTEGKGLGANLDGRSDNIKIDLRPRQLGLGSSNDYGDTWLAHQDGFEAVLLSLQGAGSEEKKETKPVKSLEETSSKQSKLHYAKFTRGKDLSCASENDLKSIFGSTPGTFEPVVIKQESIKQEKVEEEEEEEPKCTKKKSKKKRKKQQEEEEEEEEVGVKQEEEEEVREEPFKTSTISVADYFKNKMYLKKLAAVNSGTYMQCMAEMKAAEQPAVVEPISVKIEPVDDDYEEPCKKKKKKSKKTICESDVIVKQEPDDEDATTNGEADKKKKKKKKTSSTEETTDEKEVETEEKIEKKSKKKRKKDEEEETTNSDEELKKDEKKKKKSAKKEEVETQKKRKTEDEDDETTTVKKSKKNKKKTTDDEIAVETVSAAEKKKKKKKKSST